MTKQDDNHEQQKQQAQASEESAKAKGSKQQKSKVADLERQIEELTEALKRERADAINLRRRFEEQIAGLQTVAKADVVRELLPVIDNFDRALKHVPSSRHAELVSASPEKVAEILKQVQDDVKKYDDYVKGVQAIVKQFEQTLEKLGVQRIKTVGEPFNPHLHEAVSMEEGDGEHEIVSEELQSGYTLGDEVLRPAMVRVRS